MSATIGSRTQFKQLAEVSFPMFTAGCDYKSSHPVFLPTASAAELGRAQHGPFVGFGQPLEVLFSLARDYLGASRLTLTIAKITHGGVDPDSVTQSVSGRPRLVVVSQEGTIRLPSHEHLLPGWVYYAGPDVQITTPRPGGLFVALG